MSKELAKTYDPKGLEDRLYQKWLDKKYFHAEVNPDKKPFTIVIPPPNVTGQLHMGHALDETMQDILIRFKRMQGYETLWQPGTDHAAIAWALVGNPALLLADEPTGALDQVSGKEVLRLFHRLHEMGNTIVMITHDLSVAQNAGRIVEIVDGRLQSLS